MTLSGLQSRFGGMLLGMCLTYLSAVLKRSGTAIVPPCGGAATENIQQRKPKRTKPSTPTKTGSPPTQARQDFFHFTRMKTKGGKKGGNTGNRKHHSVAIEAAAESRYSFETADRVARKPGSRRRSKVAGRLLCRK